MLQLNCYDTVMEKQDEKVVEYLAQHKNILWTGIVVLTGGLVGLFLTYNPSLSPYSFANVARVGFFLIGLFFLVAMSIGLLNTDTSIIKLLRKRRHYE